MSMIDVKGVHFQTDGLLPETLAYLDKKRNRLRRRARRDRNPLHRLLRALLPADWRDEPPEGRVAGKILVVGSAGGIETLGLGAVGIDIDRGLLRIAADLRSHIVGGASEPRPERPGRGTEPPPTACFLAASGGDLPFTAAAFDSLLSDNVVEHLPEAVLTHHLREARRVLRPGGRYVLTTPNRLFEVPAREGHVSLHTYAEWEERLRAAGFRDVFTPSRRSGPLGPTEWKRAEEERAARGGGRMGLSQKGLRMVTLVAEQ